MRRHLPLCLRTDLRHSAVFAVTLLFLLPLPATAVTPDESDPNAIMRAVENRSSGNQMTSRSHLVVRDSVGRQRERVISTRSLEIEADDVSMQLMVFEEPADVAGTRFLSHDYGQRADDQWLFLPSLRRKTRIASSDKSGSFMGTDLTYADMTSQNPSDYDYRMVQQNVEVGGEACWLIEARPNNDRTRSETGYVKTNIWVSKSKLMPIQIKAWIAAGQRLKYIRFSDITQIDGVWIVQKILAQTKRGSTVESRTVIRVRDVRLNQSSVRPEDFRPERLEVQ
jgi:hypothetical protein